MNENLNLVEILKDAPKGTKLWSPICGECILDKIDTRDTTVNYAIFCLTVNDHSPVHFTANGKYTFCFDDGECVLFPSKDNRDWQKFEVPKNHEEFKPFEKVLRVDKIPMRVTDPLIKVWSCDFYNFYDKGTHIHYFVSGYSAKDDEVIPYTGNEDKLGEKVK